MKQKRKKQGRRTAATVLILLLLITGCGQPDRPKEIFDEVAGEKNPPGFPERTEEDTVQRIQSEFIQPVWMEEDFDTQADSQAVTITGNGDTIEISGKGAETSQGNVTITETGTYVLSGSFQGQILIDAGSEDLVHLILQDAEISCPNSAAIYGKQSGRIIITLAEGTHNTVADGQVYQYKNSDEDEPNAAIFSKDDLVFNGTGTLTVQGSYEDGIRTKDDLFMVSGDYQITTVKDALQGKDSVWIQDGNFVINAGNDAVKSSHDTDPEKGWVLIEGGTYQIQAADDAFHAETYMIIRDGEINIDSCYEGIEGLKVEIYGGTVRMYAKDDGINGAGDYEEPYIAVYGGSIYVNADGDGLDSNGNLYVFGGTVYIEGPVDNGNGALDYEGFAVVDGGILLAAGSAGMAMGFHKDSGQGWILYNLSENQPADTEIVIQDAEGAVIFSERPQKEYRSIVVSLPEFNAGEEYTLTCGSVSDKITLENGYYSNGTGFGTGGNHFREGGGRPPEGKRDNVPGNFPAEPPS